MAKPTPKKAAPKMEKTAKAKATREKASYPVDNNYILKRFQKSLAKSIFPGEENYGDYLTLKKLMHEKVTKFVDLLSFSATLGEGEKAKDVELNRDVVCEALDGFFNEFARA